MPHSSLFRHVPGRQALPPAAVAQVSSEVLTESTVAPGGTQAEAATVAVLPVVSPVPRPLFRRILRPALVSPAVVPAEAVAEPESDSPVARPDDNAGPTPVPARADASARVLDDWAELLLEMGFRRGDTAECPAQVSEDVWGAVFPPDRTQVLTWAGRLFLAGHPPNEAVRLATERLTVEWCKTGRMAHWIASLGPLLPSRSQGRFPAPNVMAACEAIAWTARWFKGAILASAHQNRTIFLRRTWRAAPGHCLVCGRAAGPTDSTLWPTMEDYQGGDAIHTGDCQQRMLKIGPVFGELVLAEVTRLAADTEPVAPERIGDPDFGEVGEDEYPHAGLSSADAKVG